jgi:hypothetical protein
MDYTLSFSTQSRKGAKAQRRPLLFNTEAQRGNIE